MKQIITNYTFVAASRTITLTDFTTIRLDRLQLITDVTTNTILYNFADSTVATATVATNVITLSTVGAAASTDKLQIIYDATTTDPKYDAVVNANLPSTALTAVDAVVAAPVGDGTLVSGASTSGSVIALQIPSGFSAWTLLLKGFATSQTTLTVYAEASANSTNGTDGDWVEVKGRRTGVAPGTTDTPTYAFQNNGYYRGNDAGFAWLRMRLVGTFAAGVTVNITGSSGTGAVFMNSGLTSGNQIVGKVGIDQTTPGTTNLVAVSGTVPVTLASAPTTPVTGTFFQATQPVSATALPLPTGAATDATLTGGTQQSKLTDGTNIANVLKADGTAAGQNGFITAGAGMTTATLTMNSTTPNTIWFDMLNYSWLSVEVLTNTTPATLTFQTSGDAIQTNIRTMMLLDSQGSTPTASTTSAVGTFAGPREGRYFRISSNNGAGTSTVVITFYSNPGALNAILATVSQNGAFNVGASSAIGSATPANAFSMGMSDGTNLQSLKTVSATADAQGGGNNLAVAQALYNGASYDRTRNNYNTTTGDTGAKIASFAGATQVNYNQKSAYITVLLGTVSGTTPTLTAQLQWSPDGGTTWLALGPISTAVTTTANTATFLVGPNNWSQAAGATIANLTSGATTTTAINAPLPRTWRLNYVIGGTTPSFAITGVYVNYQGV